MKKDSTKLFWVCEANLILWTGSLGCVIMNHLDGAGNADLNHAAWFVSIAGLVLAAFLQHWAYHKIYKPSRLQREKKEQNRGEARD